MRIIIIKNNSGVQKTYAGKVLEDQETYQLSASDLYKFRNSDSLITDIGNSNAIINDGVNNLNISNGLIWFLGEDNSPKDEELAPIVKQKPFSDPDGFVASFIGISGEADSQATTYIDYKLTQDRYINGLDIILQNHSIDDTMDLQIIDVDNILGYGANTVLNEFATDWNVAADRQGQGQFSVSYSAKVLTNLYLRLVYVSTGQSNVKVKINYFLHKRD